MGVCFRLPDWHGTGLSPIWCMALNSGVDKIMNRLLPIALFVTLSGSASASCTIFTTNPPIAGACDDAPIFPAAGIKDPSAPSVPPVPPVSGGARSMGDTPLMPQNGTLSSIFQTPCCVNFQTKAGTITLDLDKGTVDLHGAKLDDAARAFWDAVAQVTGHPAVKQRAYTLDDIDRMRVVEGVALYGNAMLRGDIPLDGQFTPEQMQTIESRLRTDMAAGITPEELEERAK